MNPDLDARKQLLLTRIAIERVTLRRDAARLRDAASVPHLLRSMLGAANVGRSLFGSGKTPSDVAGWVSMALNLLRRYRVAAALLGGVAPLLRGRKPFRRLLRLAGLAALGAGAWFGWRATQRRGKG